MRLFVRPGTGELMSLVSWCSRQKKLGVTLIRDGTPREPTELLVTEDLGEATDTDAFQVRRYFDALKVQGLRAPGRRLVYQSRVMSTQDLLQGPLFAGWEDWRVAFVCDAQTKGKGRGQNQWESPEGCLMVSFQVTTRQGARLPMLQYLVSLALTQAVAGLPGGSKAEPVRIKWPNDLYAAQASDAGNVVKIGGVLCSSSYWKGEFVVTIGFGLNVSNAHPTRCLRQLFPAEHAADVTRERVLAEFFNHFERMFDRFEREGFEPFRAAYERTWLHSGQQLTLEDGSQVQVEGLSEAGLLVARDVATGQVVELQPDYNSLDWFQGLVKKKK